MTEQHRRLTARHGKPFKVDSFILLRDSSPMGRPTGQNPVGKDLEMIERMKAKHVLRLDWHARNEAGDKQSAYWDGKTYLDVILSILA